jgi:VIT1/CCC1 family predicted Fe2+/Mn2+ transporter
MGQISGIVFIMGMDAMKDRATGAMTTSLLVLAALAVAGAVLATLVRESPVFSEHRPPSGRE